MPIRMTQWDDADGRYYFDEKTAQRALAWFPKNLTLFESKWAGRPFELFGMQRDIIRNVYGWKRTSDGTRRARIVYVWIPRKNTKSTFAAGVATLMLFGDGEQGGQVYCIASTEDQAKIVFNFTQNFVQASPELRTRCTVFKESIWLDETKSRMQALTGKPQGKHGLNASGLIGDEIHEWPSDELYTYVHQSEGTRPQPLDFLISTAGKTGTVGHQHFKFCEAVLEGEIDAPDVFVYIAQADPVKDANDPEYWSTVEAVRESNPGLGVTVSEEFLMAEIAKAQGNPSKINDIKRYYLNLWVDQATLWLNMVDWDKCGHPEKEAEITELGTPNRVDLPLIYRNSNMRWASFRELLKGRTCYVGGDLSSTQDLSCAIYVFPPTEDDPNWYVYCRFFLPEGDNREKMFRERQKRDNFDYEAAHKVGALLLTEGPVVDYEVYFQDIVDHSEWFDIEKIELDRWNATGIATKLIEEGFDVEFFSQGIAGFSGPTKYLERLVLQGRLDHGGHPVLRWCARNVAVTKDGNENVKPMKNKSGGRIDGIVGTIMGIGGADVLVDDDVYNAYSDGSGVKDI